MIALKIFEILILLAITVYAVYLFIKYLTWKLNIVRWGKSDVRWDKVEQRIKNFITEVIFQKKVIGGKWFVGLMHALVFWGFCVFALGTINHFSMAFIGPEGILGKVFFGRAYEALLTAFAWLVIIGIVALEIRRFVFKPEVLTHPSIPSAIIAGLIFFLMVTYLLSTKLEYNTFLGRVNWWAHALAILYFLVYIPRSKHLHLMFAPFNVFFRSLSLGEIRTLKLPLTEDSAASETEEEDFGVQAGKDFSWKDIFDTLTCIECGRCQEQCPAYNSKKSLNPKMLIQDLQHFFLDPQTKPDTPIMGKAWSDDDIIWQCTTCGACQFHCPVGIEHLPKIIGLRRYQTQAESQFPEEAQIMFVGLENNGNPWKMGNHLRKEYLDKLEIKPFEQGMEWLLWTGCFGALDPRCQKITAAMVKVLNKAGVSYGYLPDEKCCGDPARRMGNEFVYQMLAMENIENMKNLGVKKIITFCPHCLKTLKEYKDLGGEFELIHHSMLLDKLFEDGKLSLPADGKGRFVYHDPCYLGRYLEVFDSPRNVIRKAGYEVLELKRSRKFSFCCGGGGGLTFCEEDKGERINQIRCKEILKYNSDLAVACPYCVTMLSDGFKELGNEQLKVLDISEIIAGRMQ